MSCRKSIGNLNFRYLVMIFACWVEGMQCILCMNRYVNKSDWLTRDYSYEVMRKSAVLCDTLERNITQPCFEGPGFPYKCVRSQHHIKMEQSCVGPVHLCLNILYARHHNLLLVRNRSWILTIHKKRSQYINELQKVGKKYTNRRL